MIQLGSQNSEYIDEATLLNGRKVVVGDMVDLMPVNQYMAMVDEVLAKKDLSEKEKAQKRSDEEFFAKQHRTFNLQWLGRGPYKIKRILLWPCGRVMLYLDLPHGNSPGVYARDFI